MTHFVGLVVASNIKELESLLAGYDEGLQVAPYFEFLDEGDGVEGHWNELQSMKESYETEDLSVLVEHMEEWNHCVGEIRDGKLGAYKTYNPNSEWDWYVVGGRWKDIVPGNKCLIEDVPKYFTDYLPSTIVDAKGWHATDKYGWWGTSNPIKDREKIVEEKMKEHKGKKVYVVDFHI